MLHLEETIGRRTFLGSMAASAVGFAAMGLPGHLLADEKMPPPSANKVEFEGWLKKIKGKHKQVFDAPSINGGLPLAWPRVFQMTNEQAGASAKDVTAVLVLRHDAIPIGMNSDVWAKYKFGEAFKPVNMMTKERITENIFWKPKAGVLPIPGMALDELIGSGVLVGICDMALTFDSMHFAKEMNMEAAAVKKDWVNGLFPGIVIVPSGVLAINRAQEHGCTYCYAGEG